MAFHLALGKFALAAKPSHPSKLARTKAASTHPAIAAAASGSSPLVPYLPKRLNQGQSGSCTAHSFAGALATRMAVSKGPVVFVPSPRELYATTRAWERAASVTSGALPALTDSGAELADVIASVGVFGVTSIGSGTGGMCPTPDGRFSDVWSTEDTTAQPPNVNDDPDGAQLETAAADPLAGAYTIDVQGATAVQTVTQALGAGFPIYCGFFVDSAFEALGPNDIAQAPNQNDANGGGHAVFLADFRASTAVPGTTEVLLVNSWGTGWADNGTVWCSQAWLLATWELWVTDEALLATRKAVS